MASKQYFEKERTQAEEKYSNAIGAGKRRGMRSASGKTQAQIKNEQTTKNLVGFVALTAASAYIGSRIAKNKTRGAVIGGVGYAVAVFLYMKSKTKGLK